MKVKVASLEKGNLVEYRNATVKVISSEIISINYIRVGYEYQDGTEELTFRNYQVDELVELILPEDNIEWHQDIEVSRIPFEIWYKIAQSMKVYTNVAVARWVDAAHPTLQKKMSIDDWQKIAKVAGYSSSWAYNKHAEAQAFEKV